MSPDVAAHNVETQNEARLERWDHRFLPFLVAAALLPLVRIESEPLEAWHSAILWGSWAIFVIDLLVHVRLRRRYLLSAAGIFDAIIVFLTFPWDLVLGEDALSYLVVVRIARLIRVLYVAARSLPRVRSLIDRLGSAVIYVAIFSVAAALIEMRVEPEGTGFDSFGDSIWWAMVTLTTVGYGDIVPQSVLGRVVAVVLMFVGLAFLGAVAASLASFFRIGDQSKTEAESEAEPRAE